MDRHAPAYQVAGSRAITVSGSAELARRMAGAHRRRECVAFNRLNPSSSNDEHYPEVIIRLEGAQAVNIIEGKGLWLNPDSADWRKSSASGPYSDNCVQVAPAWRKATPATHDPSRTDATAAAAPEGVALRDSTRPDGPVLLFTATEWTAFIQAVKAGEFDL